MTESILRNNNDNNNNDGDDDVMTLYESRVS